MAAYSGILALLVIRSLFLPSCPDDVVCQSASLCLGKESSELKELLNANSNALSPKLKR